MNDQPRWPAGTPVAPSGKGPGGGRFRDSTRMTPGELSAALRAGRQFQVRRQYAENDTVWQTITGMGTGGRVHYYDPADDYRGDFLRGEYEVRELAQDRPDWADRTFGEAPPGNRFTRGLMSHEQVAKYVGRTDYRVFGRSSGGMGKVQFREYSDGRLIAVKTVYSENPDEVDAEVEASLVARALGVPVPAVVRDPDRPDTVLMEYLDQVPPPLHLAAESDAESDQGRLLGLLDVLIGNGDRHTGNIVYTRNGPVGIDHGLAFTKAWHLPSQQRAVLRLGDVVPTPEGLSSSSLYGRELFKWELTDRTPGQVQGHMTQWVFSGEAIREARRRVEPLRSQMRPHSYAGIMEVLDVLEPMSVGGRMLD